MKTVAPALAIALALHAGIPPAAVAALSKVGGHIHEGGGAAPVPPIILGLSRLEHEAHLGPGFAPDLDSVISAPSALNDIRMDVAAPVDAEFSGVGGVDAKPDPSPGIDTLGQLRTALPGLSASESAQNESLAANAWPHLLGWQAGNGEIPPAVAEDASRPAPLARSRRLLNAALGREPALDRVLAPYRAQIRLASVLKVAGAGLSLLNVKLIGTLVQHAQSHDINAALVLTALSLAVILAGVPLRHWGDSLQESAAAGAVNDLRRVVFSRLLNEPSFRSGGATPGVLASHVKDDPAAVDQIGVRLPVRKLTALLTLSASTAVLFTVSPAAAVISLAAFGSIRALSAVYGRVTRRLFEEYQAKHGQLNAHLIDVFENADTVLSYGRKSGEASRLTATLAHLHAILIEGGRVGARWRSWEEIISVPLSFPGAFVVALVFGLPIGAAVMMAFYASYIYTAFSELTEISSLASQHSGTIARVKNLLKHPNEHGSGLPPGSIVGEIEGRGLSFSYGEGPQIIGNLSFAFVPGSLTAVTGLSGSGKTTLLRMIVGLERPDSGRILIDGRDAHMLRAEEWRRQIGYVPQDSGLFKGTVRENLRYGKPDASDAEIEAAVRAYGAGFLLDDKERFPLGIDAPIGPKGAGLSGGQAQLVSLVRALLNHPRLILLDEPTASMDPQTEAAILDVLQGLRSGRFGPPPTIVIVTHRQGTVDIADQLLRLN